MSKVISIIALVVAIGACALTQWVYTHQQKGLERALKQREAQLSQRYAGLINRMIDRVGSGHSQTTSQTIEEALERLEEAIESSRWSRVEETRPLVDNVSNLESAQIQFGQVGKFRREGANGFASETSGEPAEPITLAGQVASTDDDAVDLQADQTESFLSKDASFLFPMMAMAKSTPSTLTGATRPALRATTCTTFTRHGRPMVNRLRLFPMPAVNASCTS